MKQLAWIVGYLVVAAVSFMAGSWSQQLKAANAERREWEESVKDIDKLIAYQNSTMGTMMDTQVRIFHYVKPHKSPIMMCPECAEILRKAKEDPLLEKSEGDEELRRPQTHTLPGKPPANPPAQPENKPTTLPKK